AEQSPQARMDRAARELPAGAGQLFWGLAAARRIQAGAIEGVKAAEKLVKTDSNVLFRTVLLEARQGLQQVEKQVADVQEQLNNLLDLPPCTVLELIEPPLPALPYRSASTRWSAWPWRPAPRSARRSRPSPRPTRPSAPPSSITSPASPWSAATSSRRPSPTCRRTSATSA